MCRYFLSIILVVFCGCSAPAPVQGNWLPLVPGHAHNDYLHDHPLVDALHYGFRSVEADIHLRGDQLMVAHTRFGIREGRTLQSLYLDPLKKLVTEHPDSVAKHYGQIILCIEIKTDFEPAYARLKQVLEGYKDMLSYYQDGTMHEQMVKVILIGSHNTETVAKETYRICTTDGWKEALDKYTDANVVSMICLHPDKDLAAQIQMAHKHGQIVRGWGDFDNEVVWKQLYDAKVDLIHTDRLEEFNSFVSGQKKLQ